MSNVILSKSPAYAAARKVLGDHRKVYESLPDAIKALRTVFTVEGFPQDFAVVAARVGEIDVRSDDTLPPLADWPSEYHADGVKVAVTFIGVRGVPTGETDAKGKAIEANGARGFAVYPLHPQDALMADESGVAWLWKVIEKEASHVALRGLRNVPASLGNDALAAAAMEMPLTVSDYVEESTRESMDTAAFDKLWSSFRKLLLESPATAALATRLPGKADVLKSIRSKAYAAENYEELETMGAFVFIGNSMAGLIDQMRAEAIEKDLEFDLESDELKGWVAKRDTVVFAAPKKIEGDLSTVDFAAFMGGVGIKPATTGETAGE